MSQRQDDLYELLRRCTVKLSVPGIRSRGTGFFVAKGLILTCAHVIKDAGDKPIKVCWQNQNNFAEAVVEQSLSNPFDLAILKFTSPVTNLPCVYLDEDFQPYDDFYSYGYSDEFPEGTSLTGECEGIASEEGSTYIRFKATRVRPGISGSPLLNLRTGKVCGIIKFSFDPSKELGGGAIPTVVIFSQLPQLQEQNRKFHQRDNYWKKLLPYISNQTRQLIVLVSLAAFVMSIIIFPWLQQTYQCLAPVEGWIRLGDTENSSGKISIGDRLVQKGNVAVHIEPALVPSVNADVKILVRRVNVRKQPPRPPDFNLIKPEIGLVCAGNKVEILELYPYVDRRTDDNRDRPYYTRVWAKVKRKF